MQPTRRLVFMLPLLACLLGGCEKDDGDAAAPDLARGSIVAVHALDSYTPDQVRRVIDTFGVLTAAQPSFQVDVYGIIYRTLNAAGDPVEASGAVFVPVGGQELPLLSIQHGTQTHRSAVATVSPSLFGMEGIVTASTGYLACMPDYLGMGASEGLHPFLHARAAANAVIDMLRAARHFADDNGITRNGRLFLAGYSQGGHVTLAAQKEMEAHYADEFALTAVVSMSGPLDLLGTARDIIGRAFYGHPGFAAYITAAYNDIYGWDRLDEIFNEPYASLVPTLFDGSHVLDDIDDNLTIGMAQLFTPAFRDRFLAGNEPDLDMALVENSLLDWTPRAPIRLYHGTADQLVPYANAVSAVNALARDRGANVELVTLHGQDHEGGIFAAIDLAFAWMNTLR